MQFQFAAAKFGTCCWLWEIKDQFPIAEYEQRCWCIMCKEAEVVLKNTLKNTIKKSKPLPQRSPLLTFSLTAEQVFGSKSKLA